MSDQIWTMVLQSSLILVTACVVTLAMRGQSAALRHLVWTLGLGFVLLIPAIERLWPESPVTTILPLAVVIEPTRMVVRADAVPGISGQWWLWLWAAGVAVLLLREVLAQAKATWLKRRAVNGISRDLAVPVVAGLWKPQVLLPEDAANWSQARLEAVLAHEQMHVLRRDLWWQLLGRIACAFYWPNPLVWLAQRAQQRECEQACDDGVLGTGMAPVEYADHLLAIARNLNSDPILEGGLSMAMKSTLEQRLSALLNPFTSHRPVSRGMFALTGILSVVLLAPVLGLKLIAQANTAGGVRGVVTDASGANVPDAKVTLRFIKPEANGRIEVTRTNAEGAFSFPSLPEDIYSIFVEKAGFAVLSNTAVKLGGPQTSNLRFALNVGGMRETMTVNGGMPPPPPPPPPPGTGERVAPSRLRIGGNVQAAKLVQKVAPIYPADCKREGVSGVVVLNAVIGKDGAVVSLEPANQFVDQRLKESAIIAAKLWRYQPTLLNGNPVEVSTVIEISFTLLP